MSRREQLREMQKRGFERARERHQDHRGNQPTRENRRDNHNRGIR